MVKYIVEHGADINKINKLGEAPLFEACFMRNENILKYLVEQGSNENKESKNAETPLFKVCSLGNENMVKIFNGTQSRYK